MILNKTRKDNLWEEYKYRHEHIWKLIFQLTTAVVALSVVPYLDTAGASGKLRFIPPFFIRGTCLVCFIQNL